MSLVDSLLGATGEIVGSEELIKYAEARKLMNFLNVTRDAMKKLGVEDRFERFPQIDWDESVVDAEMAWKERKKQGVRFEAVAVIPYVNNYPSGEILSSTELFLGLRPSQVPRKDENGKLFMHTVKPEEGANQYVPHWMGGVDAEDFEAIKSAQRRTGTKLGFKEVLFHQTLIREFAEEVDPEANDWNGHLLSYVSEILFFPPYLDRSTQVLVHPFAMPLNPFSTTTDLLGYDYSGIDIAEIYKQKWLELLKKTQQDPSVEFDVDLKRSGFTPLLKIGRDVRSHPDRYFPGLLNIFQMLVTHRETHRRQLMKDLS